MNVVDANWKCWIQRTVFWRFCLLKLIHLGGLIFHIWIGALRFNVRCCAGVHPFWNRNDQQIGDSHLWYHRSNLPTTTTRPMRYSQQPRIYHQHRLFVDNPGMHRGQCGCSFLTFEFGLSIVNAWLLIANHMAYLIIMCGKSCLVFIIYIYI